VPIGEKLPERTCVRKLFRPGGENRARDLVDILVSGAPAVTRFALGLRLHA
jgi:hypothetical protein